VTSKSALSLDTHTVLFHNIPVLPEEEIMYEILIKLIMGAALLQVGRGAVSIRDCSGHACLRRLEQASKGILHVDWKPISVFPEEAKRFR
jgi:hypothetical protein